MADSPVPEQFPLTPAYSLLFPGKVLKLVNQPVTHASAGHSATHLGGWAVRSIWNAALATLAKFAGAAGTVPVSPPSSSLKVVQNFS